ncbi:GNAT family N-acetyltransferase [Microbacterium hominis]|uniref:GNAT family N-acetyltransferase n=1 Tax=Microbacterium hominis TaxID=162426 RepID=UPI001F07050B|nr:GNAT family N-acetyltransferase [Microbacterium hominis]
MTDEPDVRRVRMPEWRQVRDLRIEAVGDPAASIAFLTTTEQERARDESFWRERAAGAAIGADAAQFIADDGGRWVGTVTVLLREPGASDHLDRAVTASRADLVGVYVAPSHRGTGLLGRLVDAAHDWALDRGAEALTLDVHVDNARAQAAYRRLGFVPTGETFSSAIGAEIVMRRPRP